MEQVHDNDAIVAQDTDAYNWIKEKWSRQSLK